jgi:uncharacterized protein YcbX
VLGTVITLRRYPVKSMLGEDVTASDVGPAGLAGDRALALVHRPTGRVVSAKNPRLWRAMLTLTAAADPSGAVRITFGDGKVAWSTDADVDDVLSGFLGQDVTLTGTPPAGATMEHAEPEDVIRDGVTADARTELIPVSAGAPDGTFFNFAPVHLLTTSTLDRIAALNPAGTADELRYRPNMIIGTAGNHEGFVENDWLGRDLAVGDLVLRVVARTPRCAVPTLAHGESLPRDPAALRVVAEHNRVIPRLTSSAPEPCAGVYAEVFHPGRIRVGDAVRLK